MRFLSRREKQQERLQIRSIKVQANCQGVLWHHCLAVRRLQLHHQGLEKLLDYLACFRAPLPRYYQHPERSEEKVSATVRSRSLGRTADTQVGGAGQVRLARARSSRQAELFADSLAKVPLSLKTASCLSKFTQT